MASPIGFLVPEVIQGQLNNPKQIPKFIGGSQFGLSLDNNQEEQSRYGRLSTQ